MNFTPRELFESDVLDTKFVHEDSYNLVVKLNADRCKYYVISDIVLSGGKFYMLVAINYDDGTFFLKDVSEKVTIVK